MFILSKALALLFAPGNLVLLAVAGVCALGFSRWRFMMPPVLTGLTALLVIIVLVPWPQVLLQPLEDRFAIPNLPLQVDGIIVLGGALDTDISYARERPAANGAIERMTEMVRLGRRYPQARMIFSGGSNSVWHPGWSEAPVARQFLQDIGVDAGRVLFEDRSRNTRENALFSLEIAAPRAGQVWLLVTSALHMSRSVGVFRAAGWTIIPYPVDYRTTGHMSLPALDLGQALQVIDAGLHEWVGLAYYRVRGWTDTLFPGP